MKTIYYGATSLNGFIADQNNSLDWLFQFSGEQTGPLNFDQFLAGVGAIAMGSTTYEWIYQHQIITAKDPTTAWPYKVPTWVFSKRKLPVVPNADLRFVKGDVTPVHAEMRAAAGTQNIWLMGGGELVGQFYDKGLLNEMVLQLAPLTLAGGAPVFPRATQPPLILKSAQAYGDAFVELRYEVPKPS